MLVPEQKHVRFRFAALHSRDFTLLWLGGIVSYIGTQMQLIGTAWLVIQTTNAALWLGVLSLCSALPMIVLPPFGGMLADRVNRITLLKWARSIQITLPLLVAFLLASGHLQLWMLCVHALLIGQLCHLRNLFLSQNHLTTLPKELGQVQSLLKLSVDGNPLTRLPETIGQLSRLQELKREDE